MNDYKLLFSEDYCPGQSVSKRTCELCTVFDVALAVRGGNDQKQNILQGERPNEGEST